MKKYFKLYQRFFENALSYEAQYRANTWMSNILGVLWMGMLFVFIETFFRFTDALGGWEKHEVYLLSLLWILMFELSYVLFSGLFRLPTDITEGNIDPLLVKPVAPLFLVSVRQIRFSSAYYLILDIPLSIWFLVHYQVVASWSSGLIGFLLFLCGIVIQYSVLLLLNTLGFWFGRFENVNDLWMTLHEMGQYPVHLLPKFFQVLFFTFVPIVFTAYVPVSVVTERGSWPLIVYTLVFTAFLFFCAIKFWRFAIKRYSSASS